jgi:broad specificity phosphatase PhoE
VSLTLHYARPGETIWAAENRYAGASDIPLTAAGVEQATALASWARQSDVQRVVSSDLQRAMDSARPSADALGVPLETEARLREVRFGKAEGLTQEETERLLPEARAAYVRAPATSPFPDAEPGTEAAARALEAVWDITRQSPAGRVLVVAHSALGRLLFTSLLGLPLNEYRRVFPWLASAALTTLRLPADTAAPAELVGRGQLMEFNRPL